MGSQSFLGVESWSYRAGEVMTILELTKEICNEEATKHKAHGQQRSVGIGPFNLHLFNGYVAIWMDLNVLLDDWVEGVVQWIIQMFVVQNQRVGFEDLRRNRGEMQERTLKETPDEKMVVCVKCMER